MKKQVKDTVKTGISSMMGMSVMGSMSNLPGMPVQAKNVAGIANAGLMLTNVGQLGKTGLSMTKMMGNSKKSKLKW
jgi:hypothetical protein